MKQRLLNVLIALDQLLLCLLCLGNSYPDETASSAAWRMELKGKRTGKLFRPLIDWLFTWIEKEHCKASFFAELQRNQAPPEAR